VLWCRAPTAFSRCGAARERRRLACGAALSLAIWLCALSTFVAVLVGTTAYYQTGAWWPDDATRNFLDGFRPFLMLTLDSLEAVALLGLVGATACATALSRRVAHLHAALVDGGGGFGTGAMFDMGDSAVLGQLLPARGAAVCVLEQMITWHGQQYRFVWWPQPWCILGARSSKSGRCMGDCANGEPCRQVGGSAAWLDGAGQPSDGWEVPLGAVRAVEGTHWLLCERGSLVSALRVGLSAQVELAAYAAALVVAQLLIRLDVFAGVRSEEAGWRSRWAAGSGAEGNPHEWLVWLEDALLLMLWSCLALLSASAHGGALLAWLLARLRRRAVVLHCASSRGRRLPWLEMALAMWKAYAPWRAMPETAPLFATYMCVVGANLALSLLVIGMMLQSLSTSRLGTAGYTLGLNGSAHPSLGQAVGRPLSVRLVWRTRVAALSRRVGKGRSTGRVGSEQSQRASLWDASSASLEDVSPRPPGVLDETIPRATRKRSSGPGLIRVTTKI